MNKDLERFHKIGKVIHKRDWLKRFVNWFLVFVCGVAFGDVWSAMAYGIF